MIIVTGSLTAAETQFEALLAACLEHSRRSRGEPGCVRHNAYVDAENPNCIFFYEEWTDRAALAAHFKAPASNAFMRMARSLAAKSHGPHLFQVDT